MRTCQCREDRRRGCGPSRRCSTCPPVARVGLSRRSRRGTAAAVRLVAEALEGIHWRCWLEGRALRGTRLVVVPWALEKRGCQWPLRAAPLQAAAVAAASQALEDRRSCLAFLRPAGAPLPGRPCLLASRAVGGKRLWLPLTSVSCPLAFELVPSHRCCGARSCFEAWTGQQQCPAPASVFTQRETTP